MDERGNAAVERTVPIERGDGDREQQAPDPTPRDRLGIAVPLLLAGLGLAAAVITWRAGVAGSAAEDANRAGLSAARDRSTTLIVNEGLIARATEAFLDYERNRRRAAALEAAGIPAQALLYTMQATTHWFLVPPEHLDRGGEFQPEEQRSALLADAESRRDLEPARHFAAAEREYGRLGGLIVGGVVMSLALPFLTLAEVARGRVRAGGAAVGSTCLVAGLCLAAVAWL